MTASSNVRSIKREMLFGIMAICGLALTLTAIAATVLQQRQQQRLFVERLINYSDTIAFNAAFTVLFSDTNTAANQLQALAPVRMFDNVIIYKLEDDQQLRPFARFDRHHQPRASHDVTSLRQLFNPRHENNGVALARPIEVDKQLLGYVYLLANQDELDNLLHYNIAAFTLLLLLTFAAALLLSLRLRRKVMQPLDEFVSTIQAISNEGDFSLRAAASTSAEVDQLAHNFNAMLARIEAQISAQQAAEQQIRQLNQNLEQKVALRTEALALANAELVATLEKLRQYQGQIIEQEKMAALGQMVAGIAHEINTPLGIGVTGISWLADAMSELHQLFAEQKLTMSKMASFLSEGNESVRLIERNLHRAADLIASFKQVAVDQSADELRRVRLADLVQDVILTLRPKLKLGDYQIDIQCPPELTLHVRPGALYQILINLIMNSLIHGFEGRKEGQISIVIALQQQHCLIRYEDNGCGVPEEIRTKIFNPFVTTKRGSGGSGLGMHLVYNLVSQGLGGSIVLNHKETPGVRFDIQFPVVAT